MRRPKALTLRPEYECWPIWNAEPDKTFDYNVDPRALGLSEDLCTALHAWASEYDATLNQDYPPDSDFPSAEARAAFWAQGEALLARLRGEAPDVAWRSKF